MVTSTEKSLELRSVPVQAQGYYCAEAASISPAPALIGLHGYGQSAESFMRVIEKLAGNKFAKVTGQGMNQLWDPTRGVSFSWMTSFKKEDSIARNQAYLNGVLDALEREGTLKRGRHFLLGFSQGSSVAFRFAQAHPERVAGIISCCADLPPDVENRPTPLLDIPVLIAYGLRDTMVPQEKSIYAADALRSAGVDVEVISFDRGHLIPSSIASRVQDWMNRNLR